MAECSCLLSNWPGNGPSGSNPDLSASYFINEINGGCRINVIRRLTVLYINEINGGC